MKCEQCGTEFEGKFCPECGAKTKGETQVTSIQNQQQAYKQPVLTESEKGKKKKPIFLRWWFVLLVIIVVGIIALFIKGGSEKIVWDDLILGDILPEPPAKRGEIHVNVMDELWVDIASLSDKQFVEYVEACKEKGFVVDSVSNSSSYDAYNEEGYKLSLDHYGSDSDMSIQLESPMEMNTITWPVSVAGKQLPTPKSTTGQFSYEYEDNFFVYVGNTTRTDYAEYVNTCFEMGFDVDYSKGDDYYYAYNSEGWSVEIRYVGNNVMSIYVDAPSEEANNTDVVIPSADSTDEILEPDTIEEPQQVISENNGINPDFKDAMDSYEEFMDEYVTFMKKYAESDGTDLGILADYTEYMSDYVEFCEDFEKWEDEELNDEEIAYYIEVQTRVNEKLLEVTVTLE